MKTFVALVIIFWLNNQSYAQENLFMIQNHAYEQVFEKAKKENKHILLFFHIDGCGACIKMEKNVFSNLSVLEYLNRNFIYYKINAIKDEGIEINKIYKTQSYPTTIVCDTSSTILGNAIGFHTIDEFLSFCERSVNSKTSLAAMRETYMAGDRSVNFLFEYCHMLYQANEVDSIAVNEYLSTQKPDQLRSKDNIQFIYTCAITNKKANYNISSPAFDLLHSHKELFYQYYDTTQVKGRIVWSAIQRFQEAITANDFQKMRKCLNILSDYITLDYYRVNDINGVYKSVIFYTPSNHLANRILYQSLIGNSIKYNELIRIFMEEYGNDPEALNELVWAFVQNIAEEQKLKDAEEWIEMAIAINDSYAYNDTFAWLLFKEGEYKQALEVAKKAIHLAKTNNEDYHGTVQLIQKIKTVFD